MLGRRGKVITKTFAPVSPAAVAAALVGGKSLPGRPAVSPLVGYIRQHCVDRGVRSVDRSVRRRSSMTISQLPRRRCRWFIGGTRGRRRR